MIFQNSTPTQLKKQLKQHIIDALPDGYVITKFSVDDIKFTSGDDNHTFIIESMFVQVKKKR